MTTTEVAEACAYLATTFPENELTDDQIAIFATKIERYELRAVKGAIADHMLFDEKFRNPKFNKILSRLHESDVDESAVNARRRGRSQSDYVSIIAQQMALHPGHAGKPEAELICLYHRYWWLKYYLPAVNRIPPDTVKLSDDQQQIVDSQLATVEAFRNATRRACAMDVSAALTIPMAEAEPWADAAVAEQHDYVRLLGAARGERELESIF